jgi:uncharacterized RDD family membrane protein YckC
MPDSGPRRGLYLDTRLDTRRGYGMLAEPELFGDVPARRVLAFLIDMAVIAVPVFFATMFIFLFGLVTFGLGWVLFWLIGPATVIWGVFYYGMTMGSAASATFGMRAVGLEIRTAQGAPCNFLLGAVHAITFWVLIWGLTPLVLLVGCFNEPRRLLHDLLLGTVVINSERHVAALHRYRWHPANAL